MSDNSSPTSLPPFPPDYRASGVLLHVTSLPSPYGIGDVGPAALAWIDRLREAGQSWWQALPLGPTGYGNSPYQSLSSFAGNGLLISPDFLIEDGLLRQSDCEGHSFPATAIDYDAVIPFKHRLLETAWNHFRAGARADLRPAYEQFCDEQAHWLEDYALFRALKARYQGAYYLEWPAELVRRDPAALARRPAGPGGPDRSGSLRAIPAVPPGGTPQGARPGQGRALDRRPALLRLPRLERRLGQPGVVPARRAAPAALRGRRASRLLQRPGTALGQPGLRLGGAASDRLSLVHRPIARPAGPRGRDSAGSLPRLRGRLARAGRGADGPIGPMGAGSRG